MWGSKIDKNIKALLLILLLVLMTIFLSSCISESGGKEINRIAIVTSIAIDYEDEMVIVTCEVVNPAANATNSDDASSGGGGGENFIYPQGKGKTVSEAINNINLHFDNKLFLSHSNMLIIGEELAKRGMTDLMDFFKRDNEPREDMYVVVAKGSKAADILGVRAGLGRASGNYLFDMLNNYPYNGRSKNITFAEKYRYFYDVSNEPVIGLVQLKEVEQYDIEKRDREPTMKVLDVTGGAALRRDRLIGYFTGDEIMGFGFIVNEIKGGNLTFTTPNRSKEDIPIIGFDGKYTTINIRKSKTKNRIEVNNGNIHLTIDVKLNGELVEINQALDVSEEKILSLIEEACSNKVEELISATLNKGQKEFKQDNFSIGVAVHQQHPELWKEISTDWNDIFPNISYDINVKTRLVKSGLINTPANLRRRK